MVLERMKEEDNGESRDTKVMLGELEEIRQILLEPLKREGKEENFPWHPVTRAWYNVFQFLPDNMQKIRPYYPGKTTVKLTGEWQGKSVTVDVDAQAPKSQIQAGGEIDYPVFVDVKMGNRETWYNLARTLKDSYSMRGESGERKPFDEDFFYPESCLELGQVTDLIKAGELQVVQG